MGCIWEWNPGFEEAIVFQTSPPRKRYRTLIQVRTLHVKYKHTTYKHIPVISIHFSGLDLFPVDFNASDNRLYGYALCTFANILRI